MVVYVPGVVLVHEARSVLVSVATLRDGTNPTKFYWIVTVSENHNFELQLISSSPFNTENSIISIMEIYCARRIPQELKSYVRDALLTLGAYMRSPSGHINSASCSQRTVGPFLNPYLPLT